MDLLILETVDDIPALILCTTFAYLLNLKTIFLITRLFYSIYFSSLTVYLTSHYLEAVKTQNENVQRMFDKNKPQKEALDHCLLGWGSVEGFYLITSGVHRKRASVSRPHSNGN